MKAIVILAAALCLCAGSMIRAEDHPAAPAQPDRAALDKQLAEKLSHSRWIGFYAATGEEGPPKQDEYTLGSVEKSEGDKWLFHANLQYGAKVITIPIEVPVRWAGDTPVISVTDMHLPGMGTYTARVMIYGDHYAGTWSSTRHGGYMWGRIEKIPATQDVAPNAGGK